MSIKQKSGRGRMNMKKIVFPLSWIYLPQINIIVIKND
jgi:hypothetical protein